MSSQRGPASPAFIAEAERQAVAAIAGFVYQVDQTILHWLELPEGACIELEAGEDIDVIAPHLASEAYVEERLMVQVKSLTRNLTLRTESAVSAVVHLAGHRHRNPGQLLNLRFVTTASPGRELDSPLGPGKSALRVWNDLSRAAATGAKFDDADLLGLHAILSGVGRPMKGVSDEDWDAFKAVLFGDPWVGLMQLVRGLTWAVNAADSDSLSERAVELIVTLKLVDDKPRARQALDALFVYVFRLLTREGARRLDASDLIAIIRASDERGETSVATLVRSRVAVIERRVAEAERKLERHDAELDLHADLLSVLVAVVSRDVEVTIPLRPVADGAAERTRAMLDSLLARVGPALRAQPPLIDPPPIDPSTVRRAEVQLKLSNTIIGATWVHLWGSIRTGKSTLARHVTLDRGSAVIWIRLKGIDAEKSLIDLRTLAWNHQRDKSESIASTLARLVAAGEVFVLDDLPELESAPPLRDLLLDLAERLPLGARLLSIGTHRLPSRLLEGGWPVSVSEFRVPRFTQDDVREMLNARGAPESLGQNDHFIAQLLILTGGHAERIRHVIAVLARQGWLFDIDVLRTLFAPDIDAELRATILRQVAATVPSPNARELLFRLCVHGARFSDRDVKVIAAVEPHVAHPGLAQTEIDGLWLEVEGNQSWSVSPAVQPFGPVELTEATRLGVHLAIARQYLQLDTLTPVQVGWAVHHFESGLDPDSAGSVLVQYLRLLADEGRFDLDPGLVDRWKTSLPDGMRPEIGLLVRAAQAQAMWARGDDPRRGVERVEAEYGKGDAWPASATVGAALLVHPAAASYDPNLAAQWLIRALTRRHEALPASSDSYQRMLDMTIQVHMGSVSGPQHMRSWIDLIKAASVKARADWAESAEFAFFVRVMANQLWLNEHKLPPNRRNWRRVDAALQQLNEAGAELGMEVISAAAVAARCIVFAQHFHDLNGAVALAELALHSLTGNTSRAMVGDTLGRQLLGASRYAEALGLLEQALARYPHQPALALDRFHALMLASRAAAELDLERAVELARQGVAVASQEPIWISSLERVAGLAELAIALWRAGHLSAAWNPFDEAAEVLLSQGERDGAWRDRFVLFGHTSGYLSSIAARGKPPEGLAGSDEEYVAPRPGMFFTSVDGREALYREDLVCLLPGHLVSYAEAVGDYRRAVVWARRASDFARESGLPHIVADSERVLAAQHFLDGDVRAGLDALLHVVLALHEVRRRRLAGEDFFKPGRVRHLAELSPEMRSSVAGWLRRVGVLAAAVSMVAAPNDVEYRTRADALKAFCCELGTIAGAVEWKDIIDLLGTVHLSPADRRIFYANHSGKAQGGDRTGWALAHLMLSTEAGTSPKLRVAHHINFAGVVEQEVQGEMGTIYSRVVVPYFVDYWTRIAHESAFLFMNPRSTRLDLGRAAAGPREHILRHSLLAIFDGLGVPANERIREWLRDGSRS